MTLSWPRLTWPAWDARQAGPRRRKMSATSTAGRDNGRASGGWLHLALQQIERACHFADCLDGNARVERGRVELPVPEWTRDIMLPFYVIGTESSVARDPMLAGAARAFVRDMRPSPQP